MKKRLNILCILVFIVLGISLYTAGYQFGAGMKAGMNMAEEQHKELEKYENSIFFSDFRIVDVVPTNAMWQPDTIINTLTGKKVPAIYSQIAMQAGKEKGYRYLITSSICTLLNILFTISALVLFIQLILDINRSKIFEWKNVRRLRRLGVFLIASFVCYLIPKITNYWGLKEIFAFDKYMIAPFALQLTDLLLGLGCLIVAETFAIGLKLKEEQELTI